MRWYLTECNGDWEHSFGVRIDTLDNPGWQLTIDLTETAWAQAQYPLQTIKRSATDWLQYAIKDSRFHGCSGPLNLEELIDRFFALLETTTGIPAATTAETTTESPTEPTEPTEQQPPTPRST
jgi:hypothetical protein